jgi:hypothetical protein
MLAGLDKHGRFYDCLQCGNERSIREPGSDTYAAIPSVEPDKRGAYRLKREYVF